ncbi:MAG: type II toxin-antitoxin system HicA family toxin [Pirellulaceae bacterium]|nr:type II toxin-antitoxin system HicA family toxin [Pirellulaceae bacterium]
MAGEKRFSDLQRMLEHAGWRLVRIRGSHHCFAKPGETLLSIPVHQGKVKPYYVRQIEKIIQGD